MATKIILYKLKDTWEQPYIKLDEYNISFNGGIAEKNWIYLGIAVWTLANMKKFAQEVVDFDFKVVTKEEAINFYTSCLPDVIQYAPQPTKEQLIAEITTMLP